MNQKSKQPPITGLIEVASALVFIASLAIAMCLALGVFELPEWARWLAFAIVIIGGTALGGFLVYLAETYRGKYHEKAGYGTGAVQSTFRERTQNEQVEDRRITPAKDTDNRVVVHFSTWLRIFGGIGSLGFGGLSYAIAQGIGEDTASLVLFLCVGLPLTFLCIFFLGYTSQFIFDHTLGNMTIRTGVGPFTYRIRHIPKTEVLTVGVDEETAEGVTLWRVSLGISVRKKDLKIIVNNQRKANYLADRIKAFIQA